MGSKFSFSVTIERPQGGTERFSFPSQYDAELFAHKIRNQGENTKVITSTGYFSHLNQEFGSLKRALFHSSNSNSKF